MLTMDARTERRHVDGVRSTRSVTGTIAIIFALVFVTCHCAAASDASDPVALGRLLFQDASLSLDGKISCQSCHDPAHAYSNSNARSIGIAGKLGTRNAPSLVGIANDDAFFWDGRRTRLEDVVLDPFTNPVELGLPSTDAVLERLGRQPDMIAKFRETFPKAKTVPTLEQVQAALTSFVRSLASASREYDRGDSHDHFPSAEADRGRGLFE